jgi:tetratricopeptide (TPR) repeat protein
MNPKITSTIEKICKLGFFENLQMLCDELLEKITSESESSYFGNINDLTDNPLYEQILLSYDKEICWFIEDVNGYDLSDQVRPEMYVEVFKQLSLISKGQFDPKNVETKECGYCEGRDKRIIVRYNINDIETELIFCADGWALMLNFLEEVNETIEHTGHSFRYMIDPYGSCFIYFVSEQQKKFLLDELGWNFISNTSYWADKAMYYKEINNIEKAEECFKKAIIKQDNINSLVQYAIFLKENSRILEALNLFELGKNILKKQAISIENCQWWSDFIDNQINEISKS